MRLFSESEVYAYEGGQVTSQPHCLLLYRSRYLRKGERERGQLTGALVFEHDPDVDCDELLREREDGRGDEDEDVHSADGEHGSGD